MPLNITKDSNILLESRTKTVFGKLDADGRKIIEVLSKELTIQLFVDLVSAQSRAALQSKGDSNNKTKNKSGTPTIQLCAILYGPERLFDIVGTFVFKCHFYLQHPKYCDRNVAYRNPHCLSPEHNRTVYTCDLQKTADYENQFMVKVPTNPIDLFADITEQGALVEAVTPHVLSTELYKHQKQALTFMMQRERGWAMDGHHKDIWKHETDALGRLSYRNMISGSKQYKPPGEFRGGLLIDAPGLGKSLSILALIASDPQGQMESIPNPPSQPTTLLVIPKTCEPPNISCENVTWLKLVVIQMWKDELGK